MRTSLTLGLAVFVMQAVGLASPTIDVMVVAEQMTPGARVAHPTPEHPIYYVAYDAGYIEAGSPIGGLRPPSAAAIAQTLRAALGSAGYEAAPADVAPSLVLVYHWGSIRPGFPGQPLVSYSNLEARLSLVAPAKMVRNVEQFLVDRRIANAGYVASDLRNALDAAQGARYFAILSAYDFAAISRHNPLLLWRVRLSAQENSGPLDEILPTLIGSCGPYLNTNYDSGQSISVPLLPGTGGGTPEALPSAPNLAGQGDAGLIRNLMSWEHDLFSGQPPSAAQMNPPVLPPALAQHINAYRGEKAALQAILAEKIKHQSPGEETSRAIDAFNSEYSGRIAALGRTRESIRGELAQLKADNPPATDDQPLDALLRDFAIDIRQLEHAPAEVH
jgi:hypothetical protein